MKSRADAEEDRFRPLLEAPTSALACLGSSFWDCAHREAASDSSSVSSLILMWKNQMLFLTPGKALDVVGIQGMNQKNENIYFLMSRKSLSIWKSFSLI